MKVDEIIKSIEKGMKKTKGKYVCIENRREAIKHAISIEAWAKSPRNRRCTPFAIPPSPHRAYGAQNPSLLRR